MAGQKTMLFDLIAAMWNGLGSPLRRYATWLTHAKFIHGVSGVIIDSKGRVLLVKHRFWRDRRWGLPGGLARRGETVAATLKRELREEVGLDVRPLRLLEVITARGLLAEFTVLAECDGEPRVQSPEIIEARFWERGELPAGLLPSHRRLLEKPPRIEDRPGLPLEG